MDLIIDLKLKSKKESLGYSYPIPPRNETVHMASELRCIRRITSAVQHEARRSALCYMHGRLDEGKMRHIRENVQKKQRKDRGKSRDKGKLELVLARGRANVDRRLVCNLPGSATEPPVDLSSLFARGFCFCFFFLLLAFCFFEFLFSISF